MPIIEAVPRRRQQKTARLAAMAAIALMTLGAARAEAATTWGSLHGAATGCNQSGDISVCVVLRCDGPRVLNVYFEVIEGDPFSTSLTMLVDRRAFPVALGLPAQYAWGFGTKVLATPPALVSAMATGRLLRLKGADMSGGIENFSLAGGRGIIDKVRRLCATGTPVK